MSSTQTIGIVGAGVAGLHLGFFLLKHGVSATIYSDRTPDQMRTSRLPSTTAFFDQTRSRERALGINFWDDLNAGISSMHIYVHGEMPLYIHGDLEAPGLFVDLRMYFARLLEEFEARGGHVVTKPMDAEGVNALAGKHDLVVVSSGRGSLTEMFPRVPERSPFTEPQ